MATGIKVANKDPNEILDYQVDWAARLSPDSDTIVSSTWLIAAEDTLSEIVIEDDSLFTPTTATVWVSGGVLGQTAQLTNRVVTAGARTYDQSILIKLVAR